MDESYCFTGYSTSGETALKNVFTGTLKKYFHWTSSNLVFSNALTQNSHSDILSNFYTILRYSWSPKHVSDSSDSTDSIHWTDNWVWCTLPLLHHHTPGIPDCRPVRSVQCTPIMALTRIRISAGKKTSTLQAAANTRPSHEKQSYLFRATIRRPCRRQTGKIRVYPLQNRMRVRTLLHIFASGEQQKYGARNSQNSIDSNFPNLGEMSMYFYMYKHHMGIYKPQHGTDDATLHPTSYSPISVDAHTRIYPHNT